jgi:hypothetical protein
MICGIAATMFASTSRSKRDVVFGFPVSARSQEASIRLGEIHSEAMRHRRDVLLVSRQLRATSHVASKARIAGIPIRRC